MVVGWSGGDKGKGRHNFDMSIYSPYYCGIVYLYLTIDREEDHNLAYTLSKVYRRGERAGHFHKQLMSI